MPEMTAGDHDGFEAHVRALAQAFAYPPTPPIGLTTAQRLPSTPRRQRLAWAMTVGAVLLLSLLTVPQVRAALSEFFQIGGVQIFPTPPTVAPAPRVIPTLLPSLLDWAGRTTLAEAATQAGFPLRLPADYGPPDYVFAQDFNGPFVILVWLDPRDPSRIALSLHEMICPACVGKMQPVTLQTTTVNGHPAAWAEGPYMVRLHDNQMDIRYLVEGHVLIWNDSPVTYRLETDLSIEEAVRLAESLR